MKNEMHPFVFCLLFYVVFVLFFVFFFFFFFFAGGGGGGGGGEGGELGCFPVQFFLMKWSASSAFSHHLLC